MSRISKIQNTYDRADLLCRQGRVAEALDLVRDAFEIPMNGLSHRMLQLVLEKAVEVRRFGGDDNVAPMHRGSVTHHSLQVVALMAAVFHRAFPELSMPQAENLSAGFTVQNELGRIHNMMTECMRESIVHDFGEIFIELSTLSTRRKSATAAELPHLERKFTEFAFRLALHAADVSADIEEQRRIFGGVIDAVRANMQAALQNGDDDVASEGVAQIIDESLGPFVAQFGLDYLPPAKLGVLNDYMGVYDQAEGRSEFAAFYGAVVKTIENLHSIIYVATIGGLDGGADMAFSNSKAVRDRLWYAERNLPKLFASINPEDPRQLKVARACAALVYETCLTVVAISPPAIDRSAVMKHQINAETTADAAMRAESNPHDVSARQKEIRAVASRILQRDAYGFSDSFLRASLSGVDVTAFARPELTATQLQAVYAAALEELHNNPNFRPPLRALVDHDDLPSAIAARIGQVRMALSKQAP